VTVADPILDYAFGAFALIQFLAFLRIGTRAVRALEGLQVAMTQTTSAVAAVEKSVEDLREETRARPCRMTLDELRSLVARLHPGNCSSAVGPCSVCQSPPGSGG
jgi:hypothetical protein